MSTPAAVRKELESLEEAVSITESVLLYQNELVARGHLRLADAQAAIDLAQRAYNNLKAEIDKAPSRIPALEADLKRMGSQAERTKKAPLIAKRTKLLAELARLEAKI